jgi:predicted CxxxxCH...CXXCH cytochrome family protein
MTHRLLIAFAAALVLATSGCGSPRTAEGKESDCTSCHGFPPETPAHATAPGGTWDAIACHTCHPATVDVDGALIPAEVGGVHGSGEASCTACHGFPPITNGHPRPVAANWERPDCAACHSATVTAEGRIAAGHTQRANDCDTCHTYPGPSGAHAAHLGGARYSFGVQCASCHPGVASYVGTGHAPASPRASFSLAVVPGGTYTPGSSDDGTCSSVYCHGASLAGGAATSPTWAGSVACGDCHALPPATGRHAVHVGTNLLGCEACHEGYTTARAAGVITGITIHTSGRLLHVDGAKDVSLTSGTWDGTSCADACHTGSRTWIP